MKIIKIKKEMLFLSLGRRVILVSGESIKIFPT